MPSTGSTPTHRERFEGATLRLLGDERLTRLAAGGDRAAFAAIFDRYQQDLYRYCASLLHDRDDAADAVQSAMVKALGALDGEVRHIALRPWLYRIAHNEAMALLRLPRTAPSPIDEVVSVSDVEGNAATRAHLREIMSDMRHLPERQRGALVMRELAGLGYDEIADALETSPAGAKQAVYEARQALHELAKGRDSDCATIQLKLSEADRRVFRGRRVRAHLTACADCRSFQMQIAARESSLAAFAPVAPAALAANTLNGAITGAAAGSAAGAGASAFAPAVSAVAVAVALGAGAVGLGLQALTPDDKAVPPRAVAEAAPDPPPGSPAARERERRGSGSGTSDAQDRRRSEARAARRRARAGPARGAVAGAKAKRRTKRGRSDADAGSAALAGSPVGAGSTTSARENRGGIKSLVRGGGGRTGGDGPIRTGIDETRGAVEGAVGEVQGALPVPTPQLPPPVVRPPRGDGGSGR